MCVVHVVNDLEGKSREDQPENTSACSLWK